MKKIFVFALMCFTLLCVTGCGCSRVEDRSSVFYNKELSFDFDSMDTISVDIKNAIEKGIEDAMPTKMVNGHFQINRTNYCYEYEEGNAKIKANFFNFVIDSRPDEKGSVVSFEGMITIDFDSIVTGDTYTITNKNHKVIEFEINCQGSSLYDEKTGNLIIHIPEFKEKGTITQTSKETTTTTSGTVIEGDPVTNTWEINDTFNNIRISFVPHDESK